MPCRPSTSDHVRASAIWPTAAAAWLSSSLSAPVGSLSTARPSAIAPEETTRTSHPSLCRAAISAERDASHSVLSPPAAESTSSEDPTLTTMRRKSFSDGVFAIVPSELFMAALCSMGTATSSWLSVVSFTEGEAMQHAVYGAVLLIALGNVLLGLDWASAPMSPMVDTKAGLSAAAPSLAQPPSKPTVAVPNTPAPLAAPPVQPNISAPVNPPVPTPRANLGAPIIAPGLTRSPSASSGASAQAATEAPAATPEPQVHCNVNACTSAYRSFRATDCTYQPSDGPRRLCSK